ncbi:helix-turn-helix domain-containing protein [Bacillus sp. JJ864]|uniref:helix-turn-helix domain-containing protein n=1 Tax=Bacillus sp. JJ864 TaxID=3122975 RepID=UPI002FFEB5AB
MRGLKQREQACADHVVLLHSNDLYVEKLKWIYIYILERTQAGRMKYVENGGKLWRTPKINKSKTDLILELLDQGKTKQEIADFLNVDRTTIYRILKRNGY